MRIRGAAVVPVPIIYPLGHGLIWPSPTLHFAFTFTGISRRVQGSIVGDVGRGVHVIPDKTAEFMLEIIRLRVTLRVGLFLDIIVKRIGINFVVGVPIYLIVVVHQIGLKFFFDVVIDIEPSRESVHQSVGTVHRIIHVLPAIVPSVLRQFGVVETLSVDVVSKANKTNL